MIACNITQYVKVGKTKIVFNLERFTPIYPTNNFLTNLGDATQISGIGRVIKLYTLQEKYNNPTVIVIIQHSNYENDVRKPQFNFPVHIDVWIQLNILTTERSPSHFYSRVLVLSTWDRSTK